MYSNIVAKKWLLLLREPADEKLNYEPPEPKFCTVEFATVLVASAFAQNETVTV